MLSPFRQTILGIARALCRTPLGLVVSNTLIFQDLHPALRKRLRSALNVVRFRERLPGDRWSWAWGQELPFEYSASVTANPLDGSPCIRCEWRAADWDGTRSTMSAEFFTGYFQPTDALIYSYRVFLPAECRDLAVPMILSQTHDTPDFHLGETWRHPIAEFRLQGGSLCYTYRASKEAVTPRGPDGAPAYSSVQTLMLGQPVFDAWNFVSAQERLSPHARQGSIRIQLNHSVVIRSAVHVGYNDVVGPFWKFGPYLPVIEGAPDRVVVYYDKIAISPDLGYSIQPPPSTTSPS